MHDDVKTLVEKAKKKGVYGSSCVFDCNKYKEWWLFLKLVVNLRHNSVCNS